MQAITIHPSNNPTPNPKPNNPKPNNPTPKTQNPTSLDFNLPYELQCGLPTEKRGIRRDEVRLMVSERHNDAIHHQQFHQLDQFLQAGDVIVFNTSGTIKAALEATWQDNTRLKVHFSTPLPNQRWLVELREIKSNGNERFFKARAGDVIAFKHGGNLLLSRPYYQDINYQHQDHLQLWEAELSLPLSFERYLEHFGTPIRYKYIKETYPLSYYQTVFATEMGSAEMPSAGRAFTPELITRLVAKGVQFLPILLHTGIASLEVNEKPYDEFYRVPEPTATTLNLAREQGRRIIAVGTTVVRALETVTSPEGITKAGEGWTSVYITPQRGLYAVNALLTGFHEPRASHLLMLEALADRSHLEIAYTAAVKEQYQWHEFGDLHLDTWDEWMSG